VDFAALRLRAVLASGFAGFIGWTNSANSRDPIEVHYFVVVHNFLMYYCAANLGIWYFFINTLFGGYMAKAVVADQGSSASKMRFIISHGDKGGVGKSVVSGTLTDYLRSNGHKVALIDADTRNPDVYRMFAEKSGIPCMRANLRNENGWMDVMDFVTGHPGHHFVMNTPAGIGEHMKRDMDMFSAFLSEENVSIALELWWTLNLAHDSVNLLSDALKNYGQYFSNVRVVCNMFHSANDPKHFLLWDQSPLRTNLEKDNGMTIYFPALHVRIVQKLFDPKNIMPFSDAIDASLGEAVGLSPSENFKLKDWWAREVSGALAPAFAASK